MRSCTISPEETAWLAEYREIIGEIEPAKPPRARSRKWSKTFVMASIPDAVLKAENARRNARKRWDREDPGPSGRRRSDAPRCACGAMTAKLAAIRCHRCEYPTFPA